MEDEQRTEIDPVSTIALEDPRLEEVLRTGEVEVLGLMPWSSNRIYLVRVDAPAPEGGTDHVYAVYKPERGERPLWDFPAGLWRREVGAYELARALGWPMVPPTVRREDGPLGVGSYQAFVRARFEEHYFTLLEEERFHDQLRRMALFDLVANNTDRKGGHCLVDVADRIWGIDNGLCFSEEFKLRTVIWDFAGEALPEELADDVAGLVERGLPPVFEDLLAVDEREALRRRATALLESGRLPTDPSGRRYPWPLV